MLLLDGVSLSWGLAKSKPMMSFPLSSIQCVMKGMPLKLIKSFLASGWFSYSYYTISFIILFYLSAFCIFLSTITSSTTTATA